MSKQLEEIGYWSDIYYRRGIGIGIAIAVFKGILDDQKTNPIDSASKMKDFTKIKLLESIFYTDMIYNSIGMRNLLWQRNIGTDEEQELYIKLAIAAGIAIE